MSLKAALIERTRPTPAADSDQLSVEHVARISQYLAGTLFRHFKLYTCVFSTPQGHTKYTVTPLVSFSHHQIPQNSTKDCMGFEEKTMETAFVLRVTVYIVVAKHAPQFGHLQASSHCVSNRQLLQSFSSTFHCPSVAEWTTCILTDWSLLLVAQKHCMSGCVINLRISALVESGF